MNTGQDSVLGKTSHSVSGARFLLLCKGARLTCFYVLLLPCLLGSGRGLGSRTTWPVRKNRR